MRIIRRYLMRTILGTTGLVLAVFLSLGAFIEFVGQLNDIGVGSYGLFNALGWVAMQMPTVLAELLPMATLLGALLGLGMLASRSELAVLQTAGVSPNGLARAVLATGLVLAGIGFLVSLYLAPPLERYSRQQREVAKFGQAGVSASDGTWIRDKTTILNVVPPSEEHPAGQVFVFRFGAAGGLEAVGEAESVQAGKDQNWFLRDYAESRFTPTAVVATHEARSLALKGVSPDLLSLTVLRSETMSGAALWRYVQYLKHSGLDARAYEVAFWSRIASVLAIPLMCVLALPFVLGPLRSGGAGGRLLAGLGIGIGWFLVSRTLADGGEVWNLDPLIVAWLPTVLLAAVTAMALQRIR